MFMFFTRGPNLLLRPSISLSNLLSCSHLHAPMSAFTRAHIHTRTHVRTHARTHKHIMTHTHLELIVVFERDAHVLEFLRLSPTSAYKYVSATQRRCSEQQHVESPNRHARIL